MKKFFIFTCLILVVFAVNGVHALPYETLLVADQNSKLYVQCGIAEFEPVSVSTVPLSPREEQYQPFLPASDEQNAAPIAAVPEPSTLGLLLLGIGVLLGAGLVGLRRRVTRKQ